MRKVSYYAEKRDPETSRLIRVKKKGWFHQWGTDVIHQDDGTSNQYTTAIIEDMETGSVLVFPPEKITFLDKPES